MLRPAIIAACLLLSAPASAALIYLNAAEVLDTASGHVWLSIDRTRDLPLDNVYTQNGWQLSESYAGDHTADTFQGFVVHNFPGHLYTPQPYNQALFDLVDFLGGTNAYPNYIDVVGFTWGTGETDGLRNIQAVGIIYGLVDGEWELGLDGSGSTDQPSVTGGRWALYRDATPDELAVVPIPAAALLPGALGSLLFLRRRRS